MIANLIADYLLNKGQISDNQYTQIFDELSKARAKLGLIAVHEGFMTEYQADTVNMLQAKMDKKFGDIAVEKGFLTNNQVDELLRKQGDPFLSIAQTLENLGIMKLHELNQVISRYQTEHELSTSSIEALKSDDIDRIVPLYIPVGADEYVDIVTIAVKTIMRCVDSNLVMDKAYFTSSEDCDNGTIQFADGNPCVCTSFIGNGDELLDVASIFGKEDFHSVDMDALDATAELLNCICGLYASKASLDRIKLELYPPNYKDDVEGIECPSMLVIPLWIKGKKVRLVICVGERIDFR